MIDKFDDSFSIIIIIFFTEKNHPTFKDLAYFFNNLMSKLFIQMILI